MDARPKVAVRAKGPVQLAATSDEKIEDFLKRYGLKSLVVDADVDVRADFNDALQDSWVADASLALGLVRAESYPEGAVLEDLQGKVTVNRKKGITITAENIRGRVNQAPVRLSGKILGVGTPSLVVDVKANTRQLELDHLRELFPSLKKLGLDGTVDMDLQIYIPREAARNSRLNGTLATRHLAFKTARMTIEKGDTELNLTGNTAFIKRAQAQVNGTVLSATGQIANPVEPNIQLRVTSPDLNLDRLIPQAGEESSGDKQAGRSQEKTMKLPPLALRTTASVQVEADKARYKGMEFQKLKADATYDRGEVKQGDFSLEAGDGVMAAKGSADLRDPERITFTLSPDIRSLSLETLARALGVHEGAVSGPVSLKGDLQGRAGSSKEILAGLQGNLDAQIGPGKVGRIGRGGELLARMLSLASLKGILTGSFFDKFATDGLPFQRLSAQTAFSNGNMDLTDFRFESDAMNLGARGRVNLIEEQMDIRARLKPLGEVSTVVGSVPLVGKVAASLTEISFDLSGSLDDPRVLIIPGQGIAGAVEDQAKGVGSVFKGVGDLLGKEENKWIRK
jgi:hypothetical protein